MTDAPAQQPAPPSGRNSGPVFWVPAGLALVVHLAVGFFYLASGLLAPVWTVLLLVLVWLGLTAAWVGLVRRRSWWHLAVPVVAALVWYAAITLGENLLGWTA